MPTRLHPTPTLDELRAREEKWDLHFLGMAHFMGNMSRDPSTRVGSIVTKPDHTVVSVGFNGFPRSMYDDPELYANKATKYPRIVHAEMNAILNAGRSVDGCTVYVSPIPPCEKCAVFIAQAGIAKVIAVSPSESVKERWGESLATALMIFDDCGITQKLYDVDPASLVKVNP